MNVLPDEKLINAQDFMNLLAEKNFIITERKQVEDQANKRQLQETLLKRKGVTISEIIKAGFFPNITSRTAIYTWINNKKIKQEEWFTNSKGKKIILTACIKRLMTE